MRQTPKTQVHFAKWGQSKSSRLIQVYNLKMIYLFNDSTITSNTWETAYLELQQKYFTLSSSYSSAIQITN